MDDHFNTSGVFEISKFDISKLACILTKVLQKCFFSCCLPFEFSHSHLFHWLP